MSRAVQLHIEVPTDPRDGSAVVTTGAGELLHLEVRDVDTALLVAGFLAEALQEVVLVQQGSTVLEAWPRERVDFDPWALVAGRDAWKAAREAKGGVYLHSTPAPLYGPEERLPFDLPQGGVG